MKKLIFLVFTLLISSAGAMICIAGALTDSFQLKPKNPDQGFNNMLWIISAIVLVLIAGFSLKNLKQWKE